MKDEEEVALFAMNEQTKPVDLEIDAGKVKFFSTYPDVSLFINGKDTGVKLTDKWKEIEPLPKDESITTHLEKNFPWGERKGDKIPVEGDSIKFEDFEPIPKEQRTDIMKMLNKERKQRFKALNKRKVSIMKVTTTDNYESDLKDEMKDLKENNYQYKAKLRRADYEVSKFRDSFKPEWNDDKERYELDVVALFNIFENGQAKQNEMSKRHRTKKYKLFYDEDDGEWVINSVDDYSHYISKDKRKTFDF